MPSLLAVNDPTRMLPFAAWSICWAKVPADAKVPIGAPLAPKR